MNYKFFSTLALVVSMYTNVKADHPSRVMEPSQVAQPVKVIDQPTAAFSLKIGFVDVGYILENLPEAKKNTSEIQSFQKQLDNQIQIKLKEFQDKYALFQDQVNTLTEAQRKEKGIELQKLELAFRELEEQKHGKMAQKYKAVMQPFFDKMQEVINKIKEENKYNLILNKNTEVGPIVLAADASFDLSKLVLEKLKAMSAMQPPVIGAKSPIPAKAALAKPGKKK